MQKPLDAVTACPVRCFLVDIQKNAFTSSTTNEKRSITRKEESTSRRMLRLLGMVVDLKAEDSIIANDTANEMMMAIKLDDGTALASILAPSSMTSKIHVKVGMTLECVVVAVQQDGSCCLRADQLVVVQDKNHESLRYLELSYRKRSKNTSMRWGYPTRPISTDDVFQIIASEGNAGVSIFDLSECLDLAIPYLDGLIQDLQLSGQVYRNEKGLYLPL